MMSASGHHYFPGVPARLDPDINWALTMYVAGNIWCSPRETTFDGSKDKISKCYCTSLPSQNHSQSDTLCGTEDPQHKTHSALKAPQGAHATAPLAYLCHYGSACWIRRLSRCNTLSKGSAKVVHCLEKRYINYA